jgi:hypothetical protein
VTNSRGADSGDDEYWRRPAEGAEPEPVRAEPTRPEPVDYSGPPAATPPPPGWRPPVLVPTPPPREMPAQDQQVIDTEERGARVVSYGVGIFAGAVVLVLIFVVCARLVGG